MIDLYEKYKSHENHDNFISDNENLLWYKKASFASERAEEDDCGDDIIGEYLKQFVNPERMYFVIWSGNEDMIMYTCRIYDDNGKNTEYELDHGFASRFSSYFRIFFPDAPFESFNIAESAENAVANNERDVKDFFESKGFRVKIEFIENY